MELNSKDDLSSALDEIMARLSVIEQSNNEKPKDDNTKDEKPTDETTEVETVDEKPTDETTEVETVDEIEKLLNS